MIVGVRGSFDGKIQNNGEMGMLIRTGELWASPQHIYPGLGSFFFFSSVEVLTSSKLSGSSSLHRYLWLSTSQYLEVNSSLLSQLHSRLPAWIQNALLPAGSSPFNMSGSGGYYKYRCKYWLTHNCSNWVWVNNAPCAHCLVSQNVYAFQMHG